MSINSEIGRISSAKDDIITEIEGKGVPIPTETKIEDIPQYINAIPTGTGTVTEVKTGIGLTGGPITESGEISHIVGSAPSKELKFYKFSTDEMSHIKSVSEVTKNDIADLGLPIASVTAKQSGTTLSLVTTGEKYSWNNKGTGNYTKPSTGIPKSDLTTSVQESLNKADTALQEHQDISKKADLDNAGKVLSSQLPSYVDDVLEFESKSAFPTTGETGKIYIATDTNKTYRWSGTTYVEISSSLALGETSSTAYRGDRGAIAYTHASDSSRLTTAKSSGLYKISTTSQGHVASVTAVEKSDITNLGIPERDTTYSVVSTSANGLAPKVTDTSKFLRGDGTWAAPASTTYTFQGGTNGFTVTPSTGTAQTVTVTPSILDATTTTHGLMSASDKSKLDGITSILTANFSSSGWTSSTSSGVTIYTQRVACTGMSASYNPIIVSMVSGATDKLAYLRDFTAFTTGYGETENGYVTWHCVNVKPGEISSLQIGFKG